MNKSKFRLFAILALAILILVGLLGWWYLGRPGTATTDQTPTSQSSLTARGLSIAVTTQPDTSPDRSLQEQTDAITINFAVCSPDVRRFAVAQGSTTVEMVGREGEGCRLNLGGEIENPQWDGKLSTTCLVPRSLGRATYKKTSTAVDLTSLDQYCHQ